MMMRAILYSCTCVFVGARIICSEDNLPRVCVIMPVHAFVQACVDSSVCVSVLVFVLPSAYTEPTHMSISMHRCDLQRDMELGHLQWLEFDS